MIDNVEALKGLYVALGGNLDDVKNISLISEMLEKISTVAAAAASELPAVSASDNGKALVVKSGKWATGDGVPSATASDVNRVLWVNSSGKWQKGNANFTFVCRVTHDTQEDTYTAQLVGVTFDVLKTYTINGFVMLVLDGWGENCFLPFAGGDSNTRRFSGIVYESNEIYAVVVECTSNGTTIEVLKLSA